MDPNGFPKKFEVVQPHVRLRAASQSLLHSLVKCGGHALAGSEAAAAQILYESFGDQCISLCQVATDSDNFYNNKVLKVLHSPDFTTIASYINFGGHVLAGG